jgi:Integrase core domain
MDWAHFGSLPLGDGLVDLFGLVAVLGCSRAPSIRFATDRTRPTALERVVACLADLRGVPKEILTDRDPAFCIGSLSDGRALLAPEWVELCQTLDVVPKACRPYRARTKGKVERMIREIKESFLPWLSGQVLPAHPTLDGYDRLAEQWREQVVLPRVHRTTKRRVGDAWLEEQPVLRPLPAHLLPRDPRPPLHPAQIGRDLEVTTETLRIWLKQADIDDGLRHDGLTTEETEEVRFLRREVKTLREEREILLKAAAFFAKETGQTPR